MIGNWIKQFLGINELNSRVHNLEKEKANLENRVIEAEKEKNLISDSVVKSISLSEINYEVEEFLKKLNIQITNQNSEAALISLNATDVVKKYGFKRYVSPIEKGYPSPVISMDEFHKHPEEYLHKLGKGFFNFPLSLNFDEINDILENKFGNINISTNSFYSNNGCCKFVLESLLNRITGEDKANDKANKIIVEATQLSHLRRAKCSGWVHIDTLDFFANYSGIIKFISDLPNVNINAKKRAISAMEFAKFSYLTALEIVGTTRIKNLSDLLKYDQKEEPHIATGNIENFNPTQQLKSKIKSSLLSEPEGTSYLDIDGLLPIRSKERFRKLASEITSNILANDKEKEGLTYGIDKPLNEYSVGEAITLASYFARNVITKYKTLEDSVKDIFTGKSSSAISGKCTDYTGLALHYLREYLVPMQPNKFRNWLFGFEKDHIGDYSHCYIKALHTNPDLTIDVYFLDPTNLAKRGIEELKSPKEVIKGLDTSNLPLMIKRDAEDLLYAAKERMK